MLDYSKWEFIGDEVIHGWHISSLPDNFCASSSSPLISLHHIIALLQDDELPQPRESSHGKSTGKRQAPPAYVDKQAHHDESMALIARWTQESYPRLTEGQLRQTLAFIAVQHRGIHPNNLLRHREIVAFLEKADAEGKPPNLHALLALANLAQKRLGDADAVVKGQAERILMVSMQAINTMVACADEGGARRLFDECLRNAEGEVCRSYLAMRYAIETVTSPPIDPRDAVKEDVVKSGNDWWFLLPLGAVVVGMIAYFMSLSYEDNETERSGTQPPRLVPTTGSGRESETEYGEERFVYHGT